jgi:WD40 repeat protein
VDYWIWRSDGTRVAHLWPGGSPVWGMTWSPDGKTIAFGDENGTLALYDTHGARLEEVSELPPIFHLAFSPDGAVLAVSGRKLELRSSGDLTQHVVALGPINDAAGPVWSPTGSVAAGPHPTLWDARGGPVAVLSGCPADTLSLAWSPDGSRLAGGSNDGDVCVWHVGG